MKGKMTERKLERRLNDLYYDIVDGFLDVTEHINARNLKNAARGIGSAT